MSIRFPIQYLPLTAIAIASLSIGGIAYINLSQKSIQPVISETTPKLETVSALGRLEPDGEVIKVFAPISGESARIERLNVQHGQQLRKGEIIAYLDNYAPRAAALREAQERVAVAEAQLRQVEAGAKSGQIVAQQRVVDRIQVELQTETAAQEAAIARLEAELRNAELEDRRYQYLQTEGAVSSSLRDSKQLTSDTVRQQLNEAKAQLSRIVRSRQSQIAESRATLDQIAEVRPVDVELARSQVAQAKAGVARAKADLDLAIVRSPQDGQVLKIHTRAGELVGNNGIISLGQTQRMVAVAEVYELDINRIKIGQSATVISKNNAFSETLRGKVKEVGLEISKKDVLNTDPAAQFDARVVEVKILLDEPSSRLVAGLTNLSIQAAIDVRD
ncbi:ABC exporter membrane fusion protein [Pseudanabaena yagii]|uniref:ABC exporter membrane fusion protein n=1 Tax=Pseudanabaena yagii GIHE-NHR1 TaxID=2722753 RepID=A0ABX1LZR6_9CYAN|nr:ABC exporter membrane fusion protein [Pseudanabaena yagii]NMF60465.1 ABC exporter membrane fusion protein [Pseudanabaena yagii GIHE-NHR1]